MAADVPTETGDSSVIGVDLGGSKLSAGWVGRNGRCQGMREYRTHTNPPPAEMLEEVVRLVGTTRAQRRDELRAVGLGIAAQVREADGLVEYAPNLGWAAEPVGTELEQRLGVPVTVVNDARAATLAAWRFGAGRGVDDLLLVVVGTGVGGGVVSGGRLLDGASHALGEVGHTILVAGGRKCHCPGRGCLEAYVGGWAIAERAAERVAAEPARSIPLQEAAARAGALGARAVREAADAGDPLAREMVEATAAWLGQGIAGLVNAFNPQRVLLGGGIIEAFPEFVPAVAAAVESHCQPPAARAAHVAAVTFDRDSVLIGAATRAYDRLGAR